MGSLFKNPLSNGYFSITKGEWASCFKLLLEYTFQSLFVCLFASLFVDKYHLTNIATLLLHFRTFLP